MLDSVDFVKIPRVVVGNAGKTSIYSSKLLLPEAKDLANC